MKEAKYKNGDLLMDNTTGLTGVVMVVAYYSTGCIHYGIQPRKLKNEGATHDWTWLDESRFSLVESDVVKFDFNPVRTSGPMPNGPQM